MNDESEGAGKSAVLVTVEPRCYREAIGASLRALRPQLEVVVVDPDALGAEIGRRDPVLVLASRANTFTSGGVPAWIDYRPYAEPTGIEGTISIGGEAPRPITGIGLDDMLSIVDRAISR